MGILDTPLPLVRISSNLSVLSVRKTGQFLNPPSPPSVRTSYVHGPLWQTFSPLRSLAPSEKGEKEISRDRGGLSAPTGSVPRMPLRIAIRLTSSPNEYPTSGVREGLKERARSQIEISIDCAAWSPARLCTNAALSIPFLSRRQICRHKTVLAVVWLLRHDNGSVKRNGLPPHRY